MGEFGFITADGVYHLTVYATDENGNFKILKMKNTYIGLPMEKTTTPLPGVAAVTTPTLRQITSTQKQFTKLTGRAACSGCLIPTVSPEKDINRNPPISGPVKQSFPASAFEDNRYGIDIRTQQQGKTEYPNFQQNKNLPVVNADKNVKFPKEFETNVGLIDQNLIAKNQFGKNNKFSDPFSTLGRTLDKEKINVNNDPNSKYHFKKMNVSDLMAILYKFNYTLTYHGHNEIGNRAGEKNGSYFFNGRDGFGRDVKYLANEFGYQPNITLVELNINDTPKEETEKELTKLLGNEFIWYY
ncbi:uncharacterized protein isoform X2 [Rhodnius prolixus]